jgi:hypothetical protein
MSKPHRLKACATLHRELGARSKESAHSLRRITGGSVRGAPQPPGAGSLLSSGLIAEMRVKFWPETGATDLMILCELVLTNSTVVHEVAHHFGISDARLDELARLRR